MHSRSPDDAELVARACRGEVDAYGMLVERYQDQALAAAYVILGDRQEAEDATQEAFTRAYAALDRFRPDGSFRAWLLRIVVNEARDLYAARQRRAGTLSRASGQLEDHAATESAEAAALGRSRREALLEALFTLPERDRLVITCRYFLDLSEADIADMLGIARGTVKSRLARALARLGPILRDLGPLAIAGPALEPALRELARAPLVQPSSDLSRWVLAHLGAAGAASGASGTGSTAAATAPLAGLWQRVQRNAVAIGLAVVAIGTSAGVLLAGTRQPPPSSPPATSSPPAASSSAGASVTVYGGDLTAADRQQLAAYFGSQPASQTQTITDQQLVETLQAHGMPAGPTDQAISSVHLTCGAPGTGLDVQTYNITGLPAPLYAGLLLVAGLSDATLQVASPPSTPVSGEDAVVGALQAFPACLGSGGADPHRVELAYSLLQATEQLAGGGAGLSAASDMLLDVLHTVVTGGPAATPSLPSDLTTAAAQHGISLDDATRADLARLFQQLSALNYGEASHGYHLQPQAPDHAQLSSEG